MKFVTGVLLLLIFTFVAATRTDCNAETSVLSVGAPSSADNCDEKKICTLKCQCGKVAFFDLTSTQFERRYQLSCLVPRVKEANHIMTRLISSQQDTETKKAVAAFSIDVNSLINKGLTRLARLQQLLNSFKAKERVEDVDTIAQLEMVIVNVAKIFEKKCDCESFVSGVSKNFKKKQCSKICGGPINPPKDPEDEDDEEEEEEETKKCRRPRIMIKGRCVCKRGYVFDGKRCKTIKKDEEEEEEHHHEEEEKDDKEEEKEDKEDKEDKEEKDDKEEEKDDKEEEKDDKEEEEEEKETPQPPKPVDPVPPKPVDPVPPKPVDPVPPKPVDPVPPKPVDPTPEEPVPPKPVDPVPEEPVVPQPEPEIPVVPQEPDQEITKIKTEISILMPHYKSCVQKRTQCCAQASPCCNQELRHSSGESYRSLFRRLARRTRRTIRNIERRNEQRREHTRTRRVSRRIFGQLSKQLDRL